MKNIRNYSVKFYHIFVMFLFVSLSFQWGFAQAIDGTIKLYFEKIEKTKAQMDVILAGDSLVYLQVYAEFSPAFTEAKVREMRFTSSTFSWILCNETGALASSPSGDVILLGHLSNSCPQGSQDGRNGGAAYYEFARHKCPTYGHFATVEPDGGFDDHLATSSTHIVKMGAIGFKLLSSDGFFVRMASTGSTIDESSTRVVFNINDRGGAVVWDNSGSKDWGGVAASGRLDLASVGGVVVKKGFKNKSV